MQIKSDRKTHKGLVFVKFKNTVECQVRSGDNHVTNFSSPLYEDSDLRGQNSGRERRIRQLQLTVGVTNHVTVM